MKSLQAMSPAQLFFYENLHVFSHAPTESQEHGRICSAYALERAENDYLGAHRVAEVWVEWRHDEDAAGEYASADTCECAILWHGDEVLASLGAIIDADDNDRRVYRAELAHEASKQLQAIIAAGRA